MLNIWIIVENIHQRTTTNTSWKINTLYSVVYSNILNICQWFKFEWTEEKKRRIDFKY